MKVPRDFLRLTAADFIVRSGYQMGKTPLLPVLAASLGATDLFLGLVVSVSTLTGLLLKPLVGLSFFVQEAAHLLARPPGGRLADRMGNGPAIAAGFLLLAALLAAGVVASVPIGRLGAASFRDVMRLSGGSRNEAGPRRTAERNPQTLSP